MSSIPLEGVPGNDSLNWMEDKNQQDEQARCIAIWRHINDDARNKLCNAFSQLQVDISHILNEQQRHSEYLLGFSNGEPPIQEAVSNEQYVYNQDCNMPFNQMENNAQSIESGFESAEHNDNVSDRSNSAAMCHENSKNEYIVRILYAVLRIKNAIT